MNNTKVNIEKNLNRENYSKGHMVYFAKANTNFSMKDFLAYKNMFPEFLDIKENINMEDKVNHPSHYCSHPSGYECIDITEHYDFCIGNAIKYLWRSGLKKEQGYTDVNKEIEDLKKSIWYINRKIKYLENIINKPKLVE